MSSVTLNAPTAEQLPDEHQDNLQVEVASQWKLMWWKFRKHKLAMFSGVFVIFIYIMAAFSEFFAPTTPLRVYDQYVSAPPQQLFLFLDGKFQPFVYGLKFERDPKSLKRLWVTDYDTIIPVGLFVQSEPYKLWGAIPGNLHLFGAKEAGQPFFLLGSDKLGRDVLSRIIYSSRISLTVGLIGVFVSLTIGVLLGGLSGLLGGWVDNIIQRLIEIFISIPTIPIWLALAAVVPLDWSPLRVYFMISIILSFVGWTGMARVVRSKFLALREEDFILAARLDGAGRYRLITKHMVPSFLSHIIASVTLAIPGMILGETGLSFLGLGLRPPVVSWGVMLKDCQTISVIAQSPWLMTPGIAVVVTVLALNFLGDGLRDAADPYQ
jgi:peptide/nickel transport system permease protein